LIDSLAFRVPVVAFALLDFFLQSLSKAGFVCGFSEVGDFALIQAHRSVANGAWDGGEAFFPHIWCAEQVRTEGDTLRPFVTKCNPIFVLSTLVWTVEAVLKTPTLHTVRRALAQVNTFRLVSWDYL
jgi:hypothetical protein